MAHFVGLDVSQEETHYCVLNDLGKIIVEGKSCSSPEAIATMLQRYAPKLEKVGFESGTLTVWLWHRLRQMGIEAICMDARHAHGVLSCRMNKTDKNDARGLAELLRMGWYKEVRVKALDTHCRKALIGSRALLVRMRVDIQNQIRGTLKLFGIKIGSAGRSSFDCRVREILVDDSPISKVALGMLDIRAGLMREIHALDHVLKRMAQTDPTCKRLMTVPGVGPITALSFMTAIDDPNRFSNSAAIGAYLGLTPRKHQSGEVDWSGRISKSGDKLTRHYLFEAATTLLLRVKRWSTLKNWGIRLSKRVGRKKATVAVARKLAVILFCIWKDGTEFEYASTAA